jgi:hypothetical protein
MRARLRGIEPLDHRPPTGAVGGFRDEERWRTGRLLPDAEALDGAAITLDIVPLEVIQKTATPTDQLKQAAAAVMVLRMGLEMLRQFRNPACQERYLHLRRAAVGLVESVVLDNS